jgi:hypothetical protein
MRTGSIDDIIHPQIISINKEADKAFFSLNH